MRSIRGIYCLLLVPLWLPQGSATAEQVYRWVDDNGKVHFGDTPPSGPVKQEETLQLKVQPPPPGGKGADYYSVINQAKRINDDLTRLRDERAEKRAKEKKSRRPIDPRYDQGEAGYGSGSGDYTYPNTYQQPYDQPYGFGYRRPIETDYEKYKHDLPLYHGYLPSYPGHGGHGHAGRPVPHAGRSYNRPTSTLHR